MRRRFAPLLLVLVAAAVLSAGCLKGGNFVYSRGQTLSPGSELVYPFSGPVNLTVKITSDIPIEVRIAGDNGVLKDFGMVKKVDTAVELPEGKWKVIIRNSGDGKAVLDIEIRGR